MYPSPMPARALRVRRSLRTALPLLCLLVTPLTGIAQTQPAPCSTPDHRAFDFWIGEWDVFNPAGKQAGTNTIESVMGGCVLHESYDGGQGYHGESFNAFDAGRGVWHQTWVSNTGGVLLIEGGIEDGAMVLRGVTRGPDGSETLNQLTWSVLDAEGNRVRQHWEISTDGGSTWTTAFDGEYRRRAGRG